MFRGCDSPASGESSDGLGGEAEPDSEGDFETALAGILAALLASLAADLEADLALEWMDLFLVIVLETLELRAEIFL